MSNHYPGPWRATESKGVDGFWHIESDSGDIAYMTLGSPVSLPANAKLVAAAPELLAACQALMASSICDAVAPEAIEAARAAIAKATGQ